VSLSLWQSCGQPTSRICGVELKIPILADVMVGELAERGDWLVVSLTTNVAWPVRAQMTRYRGFDLWILPLMEGFHPAVTVKRPVDLSRRDAEILLMRFISSIAWTEGSGVIAEFITGGSMPRPVGMRRQLGNVICHQLDLSYLPEPSEEKAMLALALMREGRALNHPAYSFLSLYRAFEVCLPGNQRGTWIDGHIVHVTSRRAIEAIAKLRASGVTDIGRHLRETCRSAIAHANNDPIINPDHPEDGRMLQEAAPVMDAIAELAIERTLGVQTSSTVYREHLYELGGFKVVLGEPVVAAIASVDTTGIEEIDIPAIDVGIRGKAAYGPLVGIEVIEAGFEGKSLSLGLGPPDRRFMLRLSLDFENEHLRFDVFNGIYTAADDGTAGYAEDAAELQRFFKDYLGNGALILRNSLTGDELSRCDPFIPLNMFPNPEGPDDAIRRWKSTAEERRVRGDVDPHAAPTDGDFPAEQNGASS
jgi:hypothetical protein